MPAAGVEMSEDPFASYPRSAGATEAARSTRNRAGPSGAVMVMG